MLIGYNPKVYLKKFLEDLKSFAKENDLLLNIVCLNEQKDIYRVIVEDFEPLFDLELWDISNVDNNMYQELKITFEVDSDLLKLLMENEKVKLTSKGDNYYTFIVLDDILINE